MIQYAVAPNHISSELSGEVVILNHKDGVYYNLDEVGAVIWQALQTQPQTAEALAQTVLSQFDVTPEVCRADLQALLDDLVKEKIVVENIS